jgi:hypothetical protein
LLILSVVLLTGCKKDAPKKDVMEELQSIVDKNSSATITASTTEPESAEPTSEPDTADTGEAGDTSDTAESAGDNSEVSSDTTETGESAENTGTADTTETGSADTTNGTGIVTSPSTTEIADKIAYFIEQYYPSGTGTNEEYNVAVTAFGENTVVFENRLKNPPTDLTELKKALDTMKPALKTAADTVIKAMDGYNITDPTVRYEYYGADNKVFWTADFTKYK